MTKERIPSKYYMSVFLPLIIITLGAYYNSLMLFLESLKLIINLGEFILLSIGPNFLLTAAFLFSLSLYIRSRIDLYSDSTIYDKTFYYLDLIIVLTSVLLLILLDVMLIVSAFIYIEWNLFLIIHFIITILSINISFILFSYYCLYYYRLVKGKIEQLKYS
ncbi:MAG: hypothetical protein HWN65_00785 [Candidatus Helarchaeota archaeon]|nr:hypothetical protein [Candidatus Helarchaeota archaeon]